MSFGAVMNPQELTVTKDMISLLRYQGNSTFNNVNNSNHQYLQNGIQQHMAVQQQQQISALQALQGNSVSSSMSVPSTRSINLASGADITQALRQHFLQQNFTPGNFIVSNTHQNQTSQNNLQTSNNSNYLLPLIMEYQSQSISPLNTARQASQSTTPQISHAVLSHLASSTHSLQMGGTPGSLSSSILGKRKSSSDLDLIFGTGEAVFLPAPAAKDREKGRTYLVKGKRKKWDGKRFARCCSVNDCDKLAQGTTEFCKNHGGGTRCEYPKCLRAARGGSSHCAAHGGGRRCTQPGCTKAAIGQYYCRRHGGGRQCKADDCRKTSNGKSAYCSVHEDLASQDNGDRDSYSGSSESDVASIKDEEEDFDRNE